MFEFRALGTWELRRIDGARTSSVALRPKQVALLAFLAGDAPGESRARDSLLGIFWPEADAAHASAALRQATYEARKVLDEKLLHIGGHQRLGVDPRLLSYDVWNFDEALRDDRREAAVALWRGPFLDGFFLPDAPEFERWLESKRSWIAGRYRRALCDLVTHPPESCDLALTLEYARRWVLEEPYRATAVCKLMEHQELLGQRADAIETAQEYVRRVREELDGEPEAVVTALAGRIRQMPLSAIAHLPSAAILPPPRIDAAAATLIGSEAADRAADAGWISRHQARIFGGVIGATLIVSIGAAALRIRAAPPLPRVVVQPFENETGYAALDSAGAVVSRYVRATMAELGTVDAVPADAPGRHAAFTVAGSYERIGDSLEFLTEITDEARQRALPAPRPIRVPLGDPIAAAEPTASRALGAIAYYTNAFGPYHQPEHRPPSYAAYLAFNDGLESMLQFDGGHAERSFRRAIELDSNYTEAYMLLAGFAFYVQPGHAARRGGLMGRYEAMDSLADRMSDVVKPLTRGDRLVIAWLRAAARGDLDAALDASLASADLIPASNFGVGFRSVWVNRPALAIQALNRLDINEGWTREWGGYWQWLAAARHELGDYRGELRAANEGRRRFPANALLREAELRAEIGLGQLGDVLQSARAGDLSDEEALMLGLELRAHGHPREAGALLGPVATMRRLDHPSAERRRLEAMALLALGRAREAIPVLERLVAEDTLRLDYLGMLGTAYARTGQVEMAHRVSRQLAGVREPYLNGLPTLWRARIAARAGERESALTLLTRAFAEGVPFQPRFPAFGGTFWHTDPDFEAYWSDSLFQKATRPRSR